MTRVKICGLTDEADVDAAVSVGADAVGFVVDVSVDTPREVPPERAARLAERVPPFVDTVLVTMAADPGRVRDVVARVNADVVQLHGSSATEVPRDVDADVVLAVDAADRAAARRAADRADAVLVDSTDEAGAGGTGRTHDWVDARDTVAGLSVPVVLAGGLTPGNVAEAVRTVRPYAVDVSTGVEATEGRKDHDAVAAFVAAARRASLPVSP